MTHLPVGTKARITGYAAHNAFTERLREMGLTRGVEFTIIRKAPFNGPIEIQYDRSRLTLRADETSLMNVKPA